MKPQFFLLTLLARAGTAAVIQPVDDGYPMPSLCVTYISTYLAPAATLGSGRVDAALAPNSTVAGSPTKGLASGSKTSSASSTSTRPLAGNPPLSSSTVCSSGYLT